MIRDDIYKIELDLDKNRIRTVLAETYNICKDFLDTEILISGDQFVNQIDPFLNSNRVSIPVQIPLPCKKYPGTLIEVDLRRKKVFARMASSKLQAKLNHFLTVL
jgi:hypothetical protein